MKTLVKISALVMAIALVCFAFAACGGNGSTTSDSDVQATSYHSGKQYATANYEEVATEVQYEDDKTMRSVVRKINKGKFDDKIVEIEGINTTYGASCGILEKNDDGTLTGVMYYLIDGTYPNDYPDKGAHIKLRGYVAVDKNTGKRYLEVPKDQLEVMD